MAERKIGKKDETLVTVVKDGKAETIQGISESRLEEYIERGYMVWRWRKKVRRMPNDWERVEEMNKRWIQELQQDPHDVWERKFRFSREEKDEEKEEEKW